MKNITVRVPEDVYRDARIRAAQEGSSVSALVTAFLGSLSDRHAEFARLEQLQAQVTRRLKSFSASDRLSRDEVHDRALR